MIPKEESNVMGMSDVPLKPKFLVEDFLVPIEQPVFLLLQLTDVVVFVQHIQVSPVS